MTNTNKELLLSVEEAAYDLNHILGESEIKDKALRDNLQAVHDNLYALAHAPRPNSLVRVSFH